MITINLNEKIVRMNNTKEDWKMLNSIWQNGGALQEHEFPFKAFFDSETDDITIERIHESDTWRVEFND